MTIAQMHEGFDLVQDKYNAPYFIDSEKDYFINRAQLDFINAIVNPYLYKIKSDDPRFFLEFSDRVDEAIQPLICHDLALTGALTTGLVSTSSINTAVDTYRDPGSTITEPFISFHIWSVQVSSTAGASNYTASKQVKYVRHNDYLRWQTNALKVPSGAYPVYRITGNGLVLDPIPTGSAVNLKITCVSFPIDVDKSNSVDCELPSFTHNKILALALEYAGVSSRDEALLALQGQVESKQ